MRSETYCAFHKAAQKHLKTILSNREYNFQHIRQEASPEMRHLCSALLKPHQKLSNVAVVRQLRPAPLI